MSKVHCEREAETLRAAKSGHLTDNIKSHVAMCEICATAMTMVQLLGTLEPGLPVDHVLPSYNVLWLEAKVRRQQQRVARVELLYRIGVMACLTAGLLLLYFGRVRQLLLSLGNTPGGNWQSVTPMISSSPSLAVFAVMLVVTWLLVRERRPSRSLI